jgi:hypothetical protein
MEDVCYRHRDVVAFQRYGGIEGCRRDCLDIPGSLAVKAHPKQAQTARVISGLLERSEIANTLVHRI